jgi:hypothetical protein
MTERTFSPGKLREYINGSELRVVNEGFRARMSANLAAKWDAGAYANGVARLASYIDEIKALGIVYPGRANPVFYLYLVPDSEFMELLSFPHKGGKCGGRPVACFDLDGFGDAYGESQNMEENKSPEPESISKKVNYIHEFAHLVHGQFFRGSRTLAEGFAEALPLYTMNCETQFAEHGAVVKSMADDKIFTMRELLQMQKNGDFGMTTRAPGKSCSFDWAYISSYLAVRGLIARIGKKFGLNKTAATQKFLEIARASSSQYSNEWLILDMAAAIGIASDELLDGKTLQSESRAEITAASTDNSASPVPVPLLWTRTGAYGK